MNRVDFCFETNRIKHNMKENKLFSYVICYIPIE